MTSVCVHVCMCECFSFFWHMTLPSRVGMLTTDTIGSNTCVLSLELTSIGAFLWREDQKHEAFYSSSLVFVCYSLQGCQRIVEDWQRILMVRSLVISPHEDMRTWLKYASLCGRSGRLVSAFSGRQQQLIITRIMLWSSYAGLLKTSYFVVVSLMWKYTRKRFYCITFKERKILLTVK